VPGFWHRLCFFPCTCQWKKRIGIVSRRARRERCEAFSVNGLLEDAKQMIKPENREELKLQYISLS
jgi:hypothetical protein